MISSSDDDESCCSPGGEADLGGEGVAVALRLTGAEDLELKEDAEIIPDVSAFGSICVVTENAESDGECKGS